MHVPDSTRSPKDANHNEQKKKKIAKVHDKFRVAAL
jgi:hypothetical protein